MLALALFPDLAAAAPPPAPPAPTPGDPTETFCSIIDIIEGNLGKALATLAVMTLGIIGMFGRLTWTQAILVATGIAVVFGALGLITLLYGVDPCGP
jgi:type IV secretory pathway VirB2 component (pilin)